MKHIYCIIRKWVLENLLRFFARTENKLWRMLYAKPRRYCQCKSKEDWFSDAIKRQSPNPYMFEEKKKENHCVVNDCTHDWGGR